MRVRRLDDDVLVSVSTPARMAREDHPPQHRETRSREVSWLDADPSRGERATAVRANSSRSLERLIPFWNSRGSGDRHERRYAADGRLLVSSDHARHLVTLVRSDTTRARGFAQPAICRAAPDAGFSRWPHRISGFRAAKQRSPWHAGAPRVAQHSTPYQGREFHSHVARYSNGCFPRGRQQSLEP